MEVGALDVRGFHFWHRQPLDRVTSPWLANPSPPAMSPQTNGTRHQAPVTLIYHWKSKGGRDGGKRMIQRLNEESGHQATEHMEVMQERLTTLEPNN